MNKLNQESDILKQKRKQMEECDHLFIKEQDSYWVGGFHSSDYEYIPCTVKCLKCGLTNYHINMDQRAKDYHARLLRIINPTKYQILLINDEIFYKQFGDLIKHESSTNGIYNYISDKVLPAANAIELYQLAREIKPDGNNSELFEIMNKLYQIELSKGASVLIRNKRLDKN